MIRGYRVDLPSRKIVDVEITEMGFGSNERIKQTMGLKHHFGNYCTYKENNITFTAINEHSRLVFTDKSEAKKYLN